MLSNTRRDNHIFLLRVHLLIQFLDHLLRFHPLALFALLIEERILLLPSLDLLVPLCASRGRIRLGVDVREKSCEVRDNVTEYGYGGVNDLVDVLGHDLKVNDAASARQSSLARDGCKGYK